MASNRIFSRFKPYLPSKSSVRDFSFKLFVFTSWVPAIIFFNDHVVELADVGGQSMYPYLNTSYNESLTKDICWIAKWKPTENLRRGMIVAFWSPFHPEVTSVKRIIALEGDTVYTRAPYPFPTAVVPRNHVWVEGDNRDGRKTLDSNYYGPIAMPLIQGKVTHVIWPLNSYGPVRWWEFKGRTRVIKGRKEEAPHFD